MFTKSLKSASNSRQTSRVSPSASAPSRAVIILPGLGNNAADYSGLVSLLNERDLSVHVLPVARIDWGRNASGLIYKEYWTGNLSPRPTVDWYLRKILASIAEARKATDGAPITLLAHSAGGWLGRCFMKDFGTAGLGIDRFVSLGSPHLAPPAGVIDQTRGILTRVNQDCPGAYHDKVQYVTVAGRYIKGAALDDSSASIAAKIAGAGYQQTCGRADAEGDGIVPVDIAHLDGAVNLTLDGAYHSPLGASKDRRWYGTPEIASRWIDAVDGTMAGLASSDGILEVQQVLRLD